MAHSYNNLDSFFPLLKNLSTFDVFSLSPENKTFYRSLVNFINILLVRLLCESALRNFSLITVWLCNFLVQKYWRKAACKMLIKFTPGLKMACVPTTFVDLFVWKENAGKNNINNKMTME